MKEELTHKWLPVVVEEACTGCGLCVAACGPAWKRLTQIEAASPVRACAAASLAIWFAVPPVTQPAQANPMTIVAMTHATHDQNH